MSNFESQVCSRCGGSGHFSFNLMHGTVCYGCSGSGVKYTKRGLAAKEFFRSLMEVPVEELQVGDYIQVFRTDSKFKEVVIKDSGSSKEPGAKNCTTSYGGEHANDQMFYLEVKSGEGILVYPKTLIRKAQSKEEKQEKLRLALAFQDTLTASGKPKKRGVK